jgi:hypothetical protein
VTPKDKYEVKKAIPANGLVKGSVDVTATGTEFSTAAGMLYLTSAAGVLYLASADGLHVFQPGADADFAYPTNFPELPPWVLPAVAAAVVGGVVAGVVFTESSGKPSASSQ